MGATTHPMVTSIPCLKSGGLGWLSNTRRLIVLLPAASRIAPWVLRVNFPACDLLYASGHRIATRVWVGLGSVHSIGTNRVRVSRVIGNDLTALKTIKITLQKCLVRRFYFPELLYPGSSVTQTRFYRMSPDHLAP